VTELPLREWLARTIAQCCDGAVSAEEILAAGCTLAAMGVDSLALVRFIDAVESELDVLVELDGDLWMRDLDSIAGYVSGLLAPRLGG
jgi:acyl carrier protein